MKHYYDKPFLVCQILMFKFFHKAECAKSFYPINPTSSLFGLIYLKLCSSPKTSYWELQHLKFQLQVNGIFM